MLVLGLVPTQPFAVVASSPSKLICCQWGSREHRVVSGVPEIGWAEAAVPCAGLAPASGNNPGPPLSPLPFPSEMKGGSFCVSGLFRPRWCMIFTICVSAGYQPASLVRGAASAELAILVLLRPAPRGGLVAPQPVCAWTLLRAHAGSLRTRVTSCSLDLTLLPGVLAAHKPSAPPVDLPGMVAAVPLVPSESLTDPTGKPCGEPGFSLAALI